MLKLSILLGQNTKRKAAIFIHSFVIELITTCVPILRIANLNVQANQSSAKTSFATFLSTNLEKLLQWNSLEKNASWEKLEDGEHEQDGKKNT